MQDSFRPSKVRANKLGWLLPQSALMEAANRDCWPVDPSDTMQHSVVAVGSGGPVCVWGGYSSWSKVSKTP